MQTYGVDIKAYEGSGFMPLVFFHDWRVAVLNHQPSQVRGQVPFVERHHETDEVFVLLSGNAVLLLAGDREIPAGIEELPMQMGKLYNVPRNLWHAVISEPETKLLIIENADTSEKNSSYYTL